MTWPWNHKTKSLHGGSVLSNSTQFGLSCIVIWKRGNFFFIHTKNSYSLHLFCYVNNHKLKMKKKKEFYLLYMIRTLLLSKLQAASHCVWLQRWRILNSNSVGNLNCSSFFFCRVCSSWTDNHHFTEKLVCFGSWFYPGSRELYKRLELNLSDEVGLWSVDCQHNHIFFYMVVRHWVKSFCDIKEDGYNLVAFE